MQTSPASIMLMSRASFLSDGNEVKLQKPPRFTTVTGSASRNRIQSARGVMGAPWPPAARSAARRSCMTWLPVCWAITAALIS